jgi:AraC-like DNA-binding protein
MSKIHPQHQDFSDAVTAFDGDAAAYRRALDALAAEIPFTQALVLSTFPRGGTQVVQPAHLGETLLKSYARHSASDSPTWQAVLHRGGPLAGDDCVPSGSLRGSDYHRHVMEPNGFAHVVAARIPGPVFQGYPGAIHLYRRPGDANFSADEIKRFGQRVAELGEGIGRSREARARQVCGKRAAWERLGPCRQFIFDGDGRQITLYDSRAPLDEQLKRSIVELVSRRLEHLNGDAVASDRVEFPDSHGENWAFRAVVHREFPALGRGPFVFLCIQPLACEWYAVRSSDFAADPEVARFVPTLRFMQQEFHRSPTLDEIAAKARLSPFHFHRRFTEMLGQTPKQFLLACQVQRAKQMLMERKLPLAQIASECGFAHQSHFTSRFRQATGLTPTRWRRLAATLEQDAAADGAAASNELASPGCAI